MPYIILNIITQVPIAIIKQHDKYNMYIRRHYTTLKTKQNTVSYHKQKKKKYSTNIHVHISTNNIVYNVTSLYIP